MARGARQQTDDAWALVSLIRTARLEAPADQPPTANLIPVVSQSGQELTQARLNAAWLGQQLKALSDQADQVVAQALRGGAAAELGALTGAMAALKQRARLAVVLDQERRGTAHAHLAQAASAIEQARQKIGSVLKLTPAQTLRESGKDPSDFLAQAQAQFQAATAALERGDLDAVRNALDALNSLAGQAESIVGASLEALDSHAQTLAARQTEANDLAELIPPHARMLAEIQNGLAPTVLTLGAGDETHPNANGTIADNIQETEAHLAAARELAVAAARAYSQARLLEGADLLSQAKGRVETGHHRLREIDEKRSRLAATETANQQALQALEVRVEECARLAEELTTMAPTLQAFEEARGLFEGARAAAQAVLRDPFDAAVKLARAQQALESVADRARCDRDVHEQAGRSLTAAATQLAGAERVAARAGSDAIPDSPSTVQARTEIGGLQAVLQSVRREHQQPHGDWNALDQEANRISSRAASACAVLQGELRRAEAAVAALDLAATTVRGAGGWTGLFGVRIFGTPGADLLFQARQLLEQGQYDPARQVAENARGVAARAIAQAEAEVTRLRLAEEARIQRERRRREAEEQARRQSYSSSSSSSSWGSSGSGASTSSFSSGSGVGRSGW